mgnify:FL=1
MHKKDVAKVREILMKEVDCKFTVKGITEYGRKKDGEYGKIAKVFRTSSPNKDGLIGSIYEDRPFSQGMNVNKFGPTCVTLYTYDMLGKRSVGKIRYADVRFVAMEQFECENPLKKLPGYMGTENCPV